jgi:acetyl-CoA carboxylase biotin carboxyl carrier protein
MSFTTDDIEQVLRIIQECEDCALYMEMGDLKLSLSRGDIGDGTGSPLDLSREGTVHQPLQIEQKATATATASVEKEEPETTATAAKAAPEEETIEEGLVAIKASVVSVFYRRPSPDEPPFVDVGSEVKEDTVVCLLEVMKCFRSVMAGVQGRVEKICVENAQLVESGTVLFLIRPA